VSSSPSASWTAKVLRDLNDATAFTNGTTDGSESEDTSIVGTKLDKKDLITSTATFLAQGRFLLFHLSSPETTLSNNRFLTCACSARQRMSWHFRTWITTLL